MVVITRRGKRITEYIERDKILKFDRKLIVKYILKLLACVDVIKS